MNFVKKQHYIPKSILDHFTNDDGKLFEVLLSTKNVYPTPPERSMCEEYAYEDDRIEKNTVEKYFSRVDGEAAKGVKNILKAIEDYKNKIADFEKIKEAIESMMETFVVFYYRSGALLTEYTSIKDTDKIPLLSKKIHNEKYINLLADTIKKAYNFAIIESDADFLISDQFISTAALRIKTQFDNISNRHIGIKETVILIPISSKHYAVYWYSSNQFFLAENEINILTDDQIKKINAVIVNNSYIKAAASSKKSIDEVLGNYRMEFPSQIYIGYKGGGGGGYIRKKEVFFDEAEKEAYEFMIHPVQNIMDFLRAGNNQSCPCNSGKKFKKCHRDIVDKVRMPVHTFGQRVDPSIFRIPNAQAVELPIDEWSSRI